MALMTLWFLQASLSDLQGNVSNPSFRVCHRVYLKVQAITLGYDDDHDAQQHLQKKPTVKLRENIPPVLVGIGAILGAVGSPALFATSNQMVIKEGRILRPMMQVQEKASTPPTGVVVASDGAKESPSKQSSDHGNVAKAESMSDLQPLDDEPPVSATITESHLTVPRSKLLTRLPLTSPSLEDLHRGSAFSHNRHADRNLDNLGALAVQPSSPQSPVGSISPTSVHPLQRSSLDAQRYPEGSFYFHSELQFVMALVEIGNRLRSVPKSARQSTLVAELTLLNHNLPADVCLPLWCSARTSRDEHHRIVRISPLDAVVLNSADRAPFLIFVEVMEYDEAHQGHNNEENDSILAPAVHDEHSISADIVSSGRETEPLDTSARTVDGAKSDVNSEGLGLEAKNEKNENSEETRVNVGKPPLAVSRTPSASDDSLKVSSPKNAIFPRRSSSLSIATQDTKPPLPPSTFRTSASSITPDPDHQKIFERRNSIAVLSKNSPRSPSPSPSVSQLPDEFEFAEKQRTAAVMLAQLYQQQQAELAAFASGTSGRISAPPFAHGSSGGSSGIGGLAAGGGSRPVPTSPSTGGRDRRKYQKMKTDFEEIRNRIVKEMTALEERRLRMLTAKRQESGIESVPGSPASNVDSGAPEELLDAAHERKLQSDAIRRDSEDPSAAVFRESWQEKRERIRKASKYGKYENWKLIPVIVKSGADLRQEQLALQLIGEMQRIWKEADVPVWVYYYKVLVTSDDSGIIETIRNSISVHSIKKNGYAKKLNQEGVAYSLYDYFISEYGPPGTVSFQWAQDNFMRSLAGYSIVSYILQVKDRHNGNILVDKRGHLIHIDFGFMLSNSPGSVGFELAPFKLPQEYIDILGGIGSEKFKEFRALMKAALNALRKKCDQIVTLVEIMEKDSNLPCFTGAASKPSSTYIPPTPTSFLGSIFGGSSQPNGESLANADATANGAVNTASTTGSGASGSGSNSLTAGKSPVSAALRERFHTSLTEQQVSDYVDRLIDSSANNMFTRLYDSFQYYAQGVF
ncbi:Phosphatidylinositol 4-kinase pik1alpha (PI4-kinase)(PtdIns-4-kinase) [Quaeritorhiza haematococci]|nr:Phosphatidylinositol 4-kinase pik1alpha (PI4-kinase)(PtdIns-4-kinase) [Quaeritorhiza haematococci]